MTNNNIRPDIEREITSISYDELVNIKTAAEKRLEKPDKLGSAFVVLTKLKLLVETEMRLRDNNMSCSNCKHLDTGNEHCGLTNKLCTETSANDPMLCCQARAEQIIKQYDDFPGVSETIANKNYWDNIHATSKDYIEQILDYSTIDINLEDYNTSCIEIADFVLKSTIDKLAAIGIDTETAFPVKDSNLYIITNTTPTGQYILSKASSFKEAQDIMFDITVSNYVSACFNTLCEFNNDNAYCCRDYVDLKELGLIDEFLEYAANRGNLEYTQSSIKVYYTDDTFSEMKIYNINEI